MKKSILSLEGVAVLTKTQQKNTLGGLADGGGSFGGGFNGDCKLTITENGQTYPWNFYSNAGTGEGVSAAANAECLSIIQGGATRCQYDCAYDGKG